MYERLARTTHLAGEAAGSSLFASVKVNASTTSGVIAYKRNSMPVAVVATLAYVHIKNPSDVACDLDIGTAATNVLSDNQMDGVGVNMPINTIYNNIDDQGTNGNFTQYVPAGGYFTAAVASGDANGLSAEFGWDFKPFTGGGDGLAEAGAVPG